VIGIVAVVGLVAYVLIQSRGEASSNVSQAAIDAEANDSEDLPGKWVNLPEIYGGPYSDTAGHTTTMPDYSEQGEPPAGGPHWSGGACGEDPTSAPPQCGPVQRGFYNEPWPAPSLVHSMEHAHVVVWYNTDDEELLQQLRDFAEDNTDKLLIVTPYDEIPEDTIAMTAWSRRLTFPEGEFDREQAQDFLDFHNCRFDPEEVC
jgi:hypothetical protein